MGEQDSGDDRVVIRRLRTGVPGLDEILGGGLPEYSFNTIASAPGCGKTTLAHQIVFANASPERPSAVLFGIEILLGILDRRQSFNPSEITPTNGF